MLPPIDEIEVLRIHGHAPKESKLLKRKINVDMNPMVDLAFLLLTFFMLATTFSKPQAMELVVPAKPKPEDADQQTPVKESVTLSLALHKDKVVYYMGITDPVTSELGYAQAALEELLLSAKRDTPGLVVIVKPLPEATFENVVAVLDALRSAGVARYALDKPSAFDLNQPEQP